MEEGSSAHPVKLQFWMREANGPSCTLVGIGPDPGTGREACRLGYFFGGSSGRMKPNRDAFCVANSNAD
jgi:hypothetical protein